jgi:hypothetical protein
MEPPFGVCKDPVAEIPFDDRTFAAYHQANPTEDSRMTATISESLYDEVMASARSKHAGATATLKEMYREHAMAWAAENGREYGPETEHSIDVLVERQLRLS